MIRISLRALLLVVALTALGAVSLKYASDFWMGCISSIAMIALFGAAIISIIGRGPRQASAAGFTVVLIGYQSLLLLPTFLPGATSPMHWSLARLYGIVETGVWINRDTNEELPDFDPAKTPQRLRIAGGRGIPIETLTERPARDDFMRVGHVWWSLILALIGGAFARITYTRTSARDVPSELRR